MDNLSLQCCELDENENNLIQKRTQDYENMNYDKILIVKGEHNDKLDRQEFSQRTSSFKFFMCEYLQFFKKKIEKDSYIIYLGPPCRLSNHQPAKEILISLAQLPSII